MKFIVDEMLGRLAKWMRIIGLDTVYSKSISDYALLHAAAKERRFIITKDTHLKDKTKLPLLLIRKDRYGDQLKEVLKALDLRVNSSKVFSRCLECNSTFAEVGPDKVKGKVPPYVFKTKRSFYKCGICGKIFWSGTHYSNTIESLKRLSNLEGN